MAKGKKSLKSKIVQILFGIALGLIVAEGLFWIRDDGAFPHVNFYQEDPELGVRLIPNSSMRIRAKGNPVSTIHVNSTGYRGSDHPQPSPGEILIVGDSQTFGLGVDDNQTFSTHLQDLTGRQVINAGIPTYGVTEYLRIAEEFAKTRKPSIVILTVNFSKDEYTTQLNLHRHKVIDGWAVRPEAFPLDVSKFPGRTFLLTQSHAIFAFRKFLHQPVSNAVKRRANFLRHPSERGDLESPLGPAIGIAISALEATNDVSDIYACDRYMEVPRSCISGVEEIVRAPTDLNKLEIAVKSIGSSEVHRKRSRFDLDLIHFKKLATTYDFIPVIAMIPLDVQVSMDEWKKYDVKEPIDMSHTLVLLRDLAMHAKKQKIEPIDLTQALQKDEPGVFLPAELHLSAKGHMTVAKEIDRQLKLLKIL